MNNRPIKFRQARLVNDKVEWHYWGFIGDKDFISPLVPDIVHLEGILFQSQQFTGLLDKNGKEIYEGDIFQHTTEKTGKRIGGVRWDDKQAKFTVWSFKPNTWKWDFPLEQYIGEFEIIGNIYETPELLK